MRHNEHQIKYKLPKNVNDIVTDINDIVLVFYEKVPREFWRIAIVTRVLPSKGSEIRGAIVRIAKTNTILKRPAKNSSQLKIHMTLINQKLLIRFNETQEMFPSVIGVFSILLTTAATNASV